MKIRNHQTTIVLLCLFFISVTACQSQEGGDQSANDESTQGSESNGNGNTSGVAGTRDNNTTNKTTGNGSVEAKQTIDMVVLGPDSVKQFEGEGDSRFLDQTSWYEINTKKRDIADKGKSYTSEDYLELALSYLMMGRFDTAIELLEECKKQAPPRQSLVVGINGTMEAAKDVKRALTAARNQLRKIDSGIQFPDERIFVKAIKSAPKDDHRLILNLSDAWATAFPESRVALLNDAEQNLGFFENWPDKTNVLGWRTSQAIHRGEGALRRAYKLDQNDPYPIIRLMQFTLATIVPKEGHPRSSRREYHPEMQAFLSRMDSNENVSDAQKAYLKYGQAMFFLFNEEGWGESYVDVGIDYLKEAIELDPAQQLYKDALKHVQANQREIERVKIARGRVQKAQSRALAQAMFFPASNESGKRIDVLNMAMQVMVKVIHHSLEKEYGKKGEKVVELLESVGCPGCWGHGENLYGGGTCPMCQGTANWYDFNKSKSDER